jgi:hypothetical protein
MNPYARVYTTDQARRVREGRERLLKLLARPPYKLPPPAMPANANVVHEYEELDAAGDTLDVFRLNGCTSMTPTLHAYLLKHGFDMAGTEFRVPHAHYLRERLCCMSSDASCATNTAIYVLAILAILRLALLFLDA